MNVVAEAAAGEAAMTESTTIRRAVWFYDLELALLADGSYHLSVAVNTVDEEEPQLLCQEIINERVTSIDEALARLRQVLTSST
jgi:hypothetical protein